MKVSFIHFCSERKLCLWSQNEINSCRRTNIHLIFGWDAFSFVNSFLRRRKSNSNHPRHVVIFCDLTDSGDSITVTVSCLVISFHLNDFLSLQLWILVLDSVKDKDGKTKIAVMIKDSVPL
jgi:hypothetical protein